MRISSRRSRLVLAVLCVSCASATKPADAQQVEPEVFTLDNGMKFLLLPRADQPHNIAAGWVAKVGSVDEQPGMTGMAHFFEHLMFKGTRTIGTSDWRLDNRLILTQDGLRENMLHIIWNEQYERYRRGEIDDPWDPRNDTEELANLRRTLNEMIEKHREVIVKDEFDAIYTRLGGSGMNAFTSHDLTFYFINVPSNRFELWAWMESDRLIDSVFREFHSERDVVHEERRLRTEATPTGEFDEQFDAMFWQSSPYSWPVIGWPSDLNSYTREEALRFYETYYQPANLVGVIVGDFDSDEIKPVIGTYFSRLGREGARWEDTVEGKPVVAPRVPPVVTLEMQQRAEKRMEAECNCHPQIQVRYHTVPHNHADSFALEILAAILNGRSGRLYLSMVEGRSIASTAAAMQESRRLAGAFTFTAQVKGETTPHDLEQAWYEELERLQNEPVSERELQKVKNQAAADAYRSLQANFFIMVQLGYYEALGGWEYINEAPRRLQEVTAEDIQRVAKTYFEPRNRAVAIYTRKAGTEPMGADDPEFAALSPQAQAQVSQMLRQLNAVENIDELRQIAAILSQQVDAAPEEHRAAIRYLLRKIEERIAELDSGESAEETDDER